MTVFNQEKRYTGRSYVLYGYAGCGVCGDESGDSSSRKGSDIIILYQQSTSGIQTNLGELTVLLDSEFYTFRADLDLLFE